MGASFSGLPRDLLGGFVRLGGSVFDNEIPIPLSHTGEVELRLGSRDEVVTIVGTAVQLELVGEPEYVEEFEPG